MVSVANGRLESQLATTGLGVLSRSFEERVCLFFLKGRLKTWLSSGWLFRR